MKSLSEQLRKAEKIVIETKQMFQLKWKYVKSLKDDPNNSHIALDTLRKQENKIESLLKDY